MTEPVVRPRLDLDSRARTLLANERTFLAWLRTGLSLVAAGLAVANFLPVGLVPGVPYVRIYSVLLVGTGTALVMIGGARARRAAARIEAGETVAAPAGLVWVAVVTALLCVMAVPLILWLR